MNKAFVRNDNSEEDDADDAIADAASPLPPGTRNYMTPAGYLKMRTELTRLVQVDRPEVVRVVSWAASNGDRSENGDYIYGKKRLREIDRRIRFLTRRLDIVEVVDPGSREQTDQVYFGATVEYAIEPVGAAASRDGAADASGDAAPVNAASGSATPGNGAAGAQQIMIVGVDEVDPARGHVSWISPIARALLRCHEGDLVRFVTPAGLETIRILAVRYVSSD
jgi:transcription elongation factor GreB